VVSYNYFEAGEEESQFFLFTRNTAWF
jgi:hypothetical protein